MKTITLSEAKALIAQAEAKWREADSKVSVAIARYDAVFKKYKNLYVQEHEGHFALLESPVRGNRVAYYVTTYYPAVYKLAAKTLEPREHKTAYKTIEACERAIDKAIDRREEIAEAIEKCEKLLPKLEAQDRAWWGLEALAEEVMKNRRGISA